VIALLASLLVVTGAADDALVRLELVADAEEFYVGQPIAVRLRLAVDETRFAERSIALFQRPLNLQLGLRWPAEIRGATLQPPVAPSSAERRSLVLDDEVVEAAVVGERVEVGGTFTLLEIERDWIAEEPGEVEIPAPQLDFVLATRFREDLVRGRVPLDRVPVKSRGPEKRMRVLPLPNEGRPDSFAGAIGRFTITAEASAREAKVDESLKLRVTLEGDGNLATLRPPRFAFPGFYVYGVIEEEGESRRAASNGARRRRAFVCDLAPESADVTAVPPLSFSFFDPSPPPGYRTIATESIPLRVVADASGREPRSRAKPRRRDERPFKTSTVVLAGVAAALLVRAVLQRVRSRRGRGARPDGELGPAAAFRARVAQREGELGPALRAFLSARLRAAGSTFEVGEVAGGEAELAAHLASAGVPADLAQRTLALLDRLAAQRYGGAAEPAGALRSEALQLVDELDARLPS
jgi:hypothetical protein